MKQVTAYEAFGIFGDYDGNAPDTSTICLVATRELAEEVCSELNKSPRDHTIVCVDGWEHAKTFACQTELTTDPNEVFATLKDALEEICDEDSFCDWVTENS